MEDKNFSLVVTYNPDRAKLLDLVKTLISSKFNVILIDNASDDDFFEMFSECSNSIMCIKLSSNEGLAKAQNTGITKAIDLGADKIIFFDQDSKIDDHFLVNLIFDLKKVGANSSNFAAIGPRFIDEKKGFYFPALKFNSYGLIDKIVVENISQPIEVSFLISSGTLVSVKALKEIGLMREEFFIDFVDTEWCFRALSKGYKLYMSEKAVMKHSIGDDTLKIANFNIPVHSGLRRYYRIRNLFFMWKMPYVPKILVIKLMIINFGIQILLLLTKSKKADYIKYYIKAIRDGLRQSKNYRV